MKEHKKYSAQQEAKEFAKTMVKFFMNMMPKLPSYTGTTL